MTARWMASFTLRLPRSDSRCTTCPPEERSTGGMGVASSKPAMSPEYPMIWAAVVGPAYVVEQLEG